MKELLSMTIGNKKLTLEGDGDQKKIIQAFSFWSQLPQKCSACKSTNIALNYKSPKGNDYYGLKCLDCGAELNFGQHKVGGTFYIKSDSTWERWGGDRTEIEKTESQKADEDLEF